MNAHIYIVTNLVNNKQYVGQTIIGNNKYGHGTLLQNAYKKYGKSNFTYEIISSKINSKNLLNYLEKFWIKQCNSIRPFGYNIEIGGQDTGYGLKHSEATKQKLKVLNLGKNHPFYGKKHSEESKQKIRESRIGKKHTDIAKANMKAAKRPLKQRDHLGRFIT